MSTRDFMVSKTAEDLGLDNDIVEDVIMDSFKALNSAAKVYNEIEISGFGKYLLSQYKLRTRITRYTLALITVEDKIPTLTNPEQKGRFESKRDKLIESLEFLKTKIVQEDGIEL